MLDEIDVARRPTGWLPTQESLLDSRRPAVQPMRAGDSRRARRGGAHARQGAVAGDLRPHAPLLRGSEILRDAQVAPRRLAVLAMIVVVAVAGLILGGRVLIARASVHPQTVVATSRATKPTSAASGSASATSLGASGPVSTAVVSTAPRQVVVQVVGQVRRPGVVTLRSGARVQDAVAAAGGALPSADLAAVNLARLLADGEQIQVPKPGQVMTTPAGNPGGPAGGTGSSAPMTSALGAGTAGLGVINLNTADATALDALPGVGPVLAQRILDWRTRNGRFNNVDELGEVSGIGDKVLQRLRPHVSV